MAAEEENLIVKWTTLDKNVKKQTRLAGSGFVLPVCGTKCVISVAENVDQGGGENRNCLKSLGFTKFGDNVEITLGLAETWAEKLLEKCIMTMKPGEKSCFQLDLKEQSKCKEDLSDGKSDLDLSCVHINLTLHEIDDSKPPWGMSPSEKYEVGLSHKEMGNQLFKDGRTEAAFYRYSTGLKYLISIPSYSEILLPIYEINATDKEKYDQLKCTCYLNLAACQAKYSNHDAVITNCSEALALCPANVKGLYRRAQAYLALGKNNLAKQDLTRAKSLEPRNKAVMDLLKSCQGDS